MPFIKRLGFFLAGMSVGLIFLAFFLKKKTEATGTMFCYFPNCRVLKELRSKPLSYSDQMAALMEEGKIDSTDLAYFLNEGDIDFSRSNPQAKPCNNYIIEGVLHEQPTVLEVKRCDSVVVAERFMPLE